MFLKRIAVCLMALTCLPVAQAKADSVLFSIQSEYKYIIHLAFYSSDRDWEWPGGDEVYVIDNYEVYDFHLNCQYGEKICYGAWPKGSRKTYWGVGRDGRQGCENCCIRCEGGETGVIVLQD